MPHLVLEYSGNARENFEPHSFFNKLHAELAAVGGFRLQDFKSRAVRMDAYLIGDGSYEQSFVNLDIRTFGGKSPEDKEVISKSALAILATEFQGTLRQTACDISVQITELDRPSYSRTRSEEHSAT